MSADNDTKLPPEQELIRAKCFHPNGNFVEFEDAEIEQSIPERFEKIVGRYAERIAVKTPNHSLTYDELNKAANRVARSILALIGEAKSPLRFFLSTGLSSSSGFWGF